MRFGDSVKIIAVEKLYGRSEQLIKMLEEIKEKEIIGKVISVDEEDCLLTIYVSFKGYDNLWMAEEELEKVCAYDNLKLVDNIDELLETMKEIYEETDIKEVEENVDEFEDWDETEIEEIEFEKVEEFKIEEENMDRKLLNYLIEKFYYNGIDEVLDDYYRDELINYIVKADILFDSEDVGAICRIVDIMLELFKLNKGDIQSALERKEFERRNNDDDFDDLEF